MPLLGLVWFKGDNDWRERARRAGWRDVKIAWVVFVVTVLFVLL